MFCDLYMKWLCYVIFFFSLPSRVIVGLLFRLCALRLLYIYLWCLVVLARVRIYINTLHFSFHLVLLLVCFSAVCI